ncbi:uncharacterized protein SPSK_00363 [Sporothrix schenckii 1099-18]|uniref:Uncharacterized protein n=1 Tax=Sporothrix schenckii 1099-18 TaxID=1397361 RepID=A0A0F2M2S7_SPOSC|nr:uncharacterized protein SPSK_00363 [Sporothrix schenckii 1099-18]KJR83997.1 hypothetical protein SPSK_00363 [Sporothrix schenckii 1099-18]
MQRNVNCEMLPPYSRDGKNVVAHLPLRILLPRNMEKLGMTLGEATGFAAGKYRVPLVAKEKARRRLRLHGN